MRQYTINTCQLIRLIYSHLYYFKGGNPPFHMLSSVTCHKEHIPACANSFKASLSCSVGLLAGSYNFQMIKPKSMLGYAGAAHV